MRGEVPDGDVHAPGHGQAGGGAGVPHQGQDAALLQPHLGGGVRPAHRPAARRQQDLSALVRLVHP